MLFRKVPGQGVTLVINLYYNSVWECKGFYVNL